jgi:hypothetical protein
MVRNHVLHCSDPTSQSARPLICISRCLGALYGIEDQYAGLGVCFGRSMSLVGVGIYYTRIA